LLVKFKAANLWLVPINTRHVMATQFNWRPKRRQNIITAFTRLPQG